MHRSVSLLGAVILGYLATACSDSTGLNSGQGSVSFQMASKASVAPSGRIGGPLFSVAAVPDTLSLGGNVLVITEAELVLKRIELERAGAGDCETEFDGSECDELKAGPLLVDLPLTAGATQSFNLAVDTGSYTKLHIHIHKVSGTDSTDQTFLAAHPDLNGTSIKVTGTYNGTPFTYTTDLDAEQEMELVPPLTVSSAGSIGLTLFADVNTWFLDEAKTGLVDPASALTGQLNESLVENNIKASFRTFKDDDHNGESDN